MMTDGTSCRQRDIAFARVRFSDSSGNKYRPVLIISNTTFNAKNDDLICCAITSNIEHLHNSLALRTCDFESGRLPLSSRVKYMDVLAISKTVLEKPVARLDEERSREVVRALRAKIEIQPVANGTYLFVYIKRA